MNKWLEKIKNMKKEQYFMLFLSGILCMIILWPTESGQNSVKDNEKNVSEYHLGDPVSDNMGYETEDTSMTFEKQYTQYLEEKLEKILSGIDHAGTVRVMISLDSLEEKIVEKEQNSAEAESTVYMQMDNGVKTPFVAKTYVPKLSGVVVTAEGAGTGTVSNDITTALEALFGLDAHKIIVLKKSVYEG
ncbi:MAG: hypothetical protein PHP50_05935 [Lachnospiraceae bacterium]|nr:hypothetical protein [Lachnospiraceae bacterium]